MTTSVVLRPARPTMDEGVRFARYLNQASHGLVAGLFGPRFERIIGRAYLSSGHDLSFQTAVFAETAGGEIVGMVSAYSASEHADASGSMLLDEAERRVLKAGCRRLALDVAVDNDGARRLYERRGMTVDSLSPAPFRRPDQRVHRMVKVVTGIPT